MKITSLKICNILNCRQADISFCKPNDVSPPIYLIHGPKKSEVITLAIQLMCSSKYDTYPKLNDIWSKIRNGIVEIAFQLPVEGRDDATAVDPGNFISDSDDDVPCTSQQAKIRAEQRKKQKQKHTGSTRVRAFEVKAWRNFEADPLEVEYSINSGPRLKCTMLKFNKQFFSCTDIILPRLSSLIDGVCSDGRWLDLLSTDFIYKGKGENNSIVQFCKLYSTGKVFLESPVGQLTTSVLIGRYSLDRTRIAHLIQIFQHIRCLFEYLTFSEYTVWFFLPQLYGSDLRDIAEVKTNSINFDLMQTKIQLKTPQGETVSSPKYPWTDAVGYVRELFLISVQLAFGFSCHQNIIYLHSLQELKSHQSFEYIRYTFACNTGGTLPPVRDYLQRIVNACVKCNLTCIIEYMGGIPFMPKNCFVIKSKW